MTMKLPDGREWTFANTIRWLVRMPNKDWPTNLDDYPAIVRMCVDAIQEAKGDFSGLKALMERVEGKPVEQRLSANVTAELLRESAFARTIRDMQTNAMAITDEESKPVYPDPAKRKDRPMVTNIKDVADDLSIMFQDTPSSRERVRQAVAEARRVAKDAEVSVPVESDTGGATT